MKNYYDILEVKREASFYDIRDAYRRLARKHHPDRSSDKGKYEKFIDIAEAYEILSDSQKRHLYEVLLNQSINMKKGSFGRYSDLDYYRQKYEQWHEILSEYVFEAKKKARKSVENSLEDVMKNISKDNLSENGISSQVNIDSSKSIGIIQKLGNIIQFAIVIAVISTVVYVGKITIEDFNSHKSDSNRVADEYIIPNSESDYISENDIARLKSSNDSKLIRRAINEIYARHGLTFSNSENQEYFDSKSWYIPDYSIKSGSQVEYNFNDVEKANIEKLVMVENEIKDGE